MAMQSQVPYQNVSPLKILSLDGGGIRGLSSLIILKYLMKRVDPQNPPKPCNYFDLIGGTSTGGIIALMLGRFHMSVDECIAKYLDLSSAAFQPKRAKLNFLGKGKDLWKADGAYRGERLASEFKVVSKKLEGDEDAKLASADTACRVFVCAFTKALNTPVRLRSYVTDDSIDSLAGSGCTVWEAARATSAAATFFDPIQIGRQKFVDGATGFNNPVEVVLEETLSVWPDAVSRIQCLVSIGTGIGDMKDFGDNMKEVIETLKAIATETETTEKRFFNNHAALGIGDRYFRFNVDRGMSGIGLDEHKKMDKIEAGAELYLADPRVKGIVEKFVKAHAPLNVSIQAHVKDLYLSWLPYIDPLEFHNIARSHRTAKSTGQWFLKGEFEWFRTRKRSILWLHAKAGSGKTVLLSAIIDEIEQRKLGNVAYFYFSYSSKDRQDLWQDLRHFKYSILVQLVCRQIRKDPNLFNHYYVPTAFQRLYHAYHPSRNPRDEDIDATILALLNEVKETYIVIDALDEFSSPADVVLFLDRLCLRALTSVHILFTSRREEDIELAVGDVSVVKRIVTLDVLKVNEDIRTHLQECMSRPPYVRWKDELKGKVVNHLSDHAGGVFRWADLQIQELGKKAREKDVDKALKKLPKTLEETYERILRQIDEDYAEEAHAILQWLAYSCQPLSLEQVAEIAAFDTSPGQSSDSEDYNVSFTPENRFDSVSWVRRILSGLVIVTGVDDRPSFLPNDSQVLTEEQQETDATDSINLSLSPSDEYDTNPVKRSSISSYGSEMETKFTGLPVSSETDQVLRSIPEGTVLFAHFSVKEYLESTNVHPSHFKLVETQGHGYIFKSSLAYLRHYDTKCFTELDSGIQPLLIYAWLNWAYHANACLKNAAQTEIGALISKLANVCGNAFLLSASVISFKLPWYLSDQAPEDFEISQNLVSVLEQLLAGSRYKDYFSTESLPGIHLLNDPARDVWTASWAGHEEHVKVLLDGGYNVNMVFYKSLGKHMRRGWTPLHSAAEGGHSDVIKLLIVNGANVDAEFLVSDTTVESWPLVSLAQNFGHMELAQLFSDRQVVQTRQYQHHGITPLAVATAAGNHEAVLQLLDSGADATISTWLSDLSLLSQHKPSMPPNRSDESSEDETSGDLEW